MENHKLFSIFLGFVFLISFASAQSVSIDLFYDSTNDSSLEIMEGDSFGVIVSAHSILENSMSIEIDLLDSEGNLVENLLDVDTSQNLYFNYFVIDENVYGNPGEYSIRGSVFGFPSLNLETKFLSLSVLPQNLGNNPPEITSVAPSRVNGSYLYSYQIIAEDADNDTLTYSLTQNPSWLSINSNGFISGIAPNLDYQYIVTARVSDGIDFDAQTFTIDVTAVDDPADPPEPTPIVISQIP
ncbi:MAG: putative Ig domain-containing protein, partial [Candidatus Pacearchaeota archaeon]